MQVAGFLLVLSLAGQVPAGASSAPPPPGSLAATPQADASPTAWSCTVETLSSGKDCVFESEADKASDLATQETQNIRFAKQLATLACGRATRPSSGKVDKKLTDMCQREFAAAAETCGLGGEWPLVDARGRFAPAARTCYLALADVLQRAVFAGATASRCCQCLAATSCRSSSEKCYRDLARGSPDSTELACMNNACAQECSGVPVSESESNTGSRPTKPSAFHGSHEL